MKTAVDTNILVQLLKPDGRQAEDADAMLAEASRSGSVVISEPVYAELSSQFPDRRGLDRFLSSTGTALERLTEDALNLAGRRWSAYSRRRGASLACPSCGTANRPPCRRCGAVIAVRQHVLADFLIGAHAELQADRLLTRDRGYYRTYFPELKLA